jgi:hypothetical protein
MTTSKELMSIGKFIQRLTYKLQNFREMFESPFTSHFSEKVMAQKNIHIIPENVTKIVELENELNEIRSEFLQKLSKTSQKTTKQIYILHYIHCKSVYEIGEIYQKTPRWVYLQLKKL